MPAESEPQPAFGEADLSNCEREQIHLAGSIQPHGALLAVTEPDLIVVQTSSNAAAFLDQSNSLLERSLHELHGNVAVRVQPHLDYPIQDIPVPIRCEMGEPRQEFNALLHRTPDGVLVVEFEKASPTVDYRGGLGQMLQSIAACPSLRALCDETASLFKEMTGYDRVMVYKFDEEGHGEVFSEAKRHDLEPFLGMRYPASDIPQIARRLYERNRVRVLVDIEYEPVPLTPRLLPVTGRDLDMSLCFLRSISPIHVQYLKNMGVNGTLVVSLMVGGKLWGLIACHHYERRLVQFEMRAVCEFLAEVVATRIMALESFLLAQPEIAVRRLEQRMADAIASEGDWRSALFDSSHSLLQTVNATGAALLFDGQVQTAGEVPATKRLREIGRWVEQRSSGGVFSTNSLTVDEPEFQSVVGVASGVLAVPVSSTPGEYLLWFRPEQVRMVTWGGNPFKPVIVGDDPSELSPRRSFAQWNQLVEGKSAPWTPADLAAAKMIGETVVDIVLQFRSVRMLIAQDQLDKVSRDVRISDQPVVIADARGRILLSNEAFERLLSAAHPHAERLDNLSQFFHDSSAVRERFRNLVARRQSWRGELRLRAGGADLKPVLLRADPILSAPDVVLGYVLLFTDLTERKAAETARRRFQDGILERPAMPARLDSQSDLLYHNLFASVVENAQLAALEITDSLDMANMPQLLESVRRSVARTADVLEYLIHAHDLGPGGDGDDLKGGRGRSANGHQPPRPSERLRKPRY